MSHTPGIRPEFDLSVMEQYKNGIYHLEAVAKLVLSAPAAHEQSAYAT
jgi:hypothetical protein